MLRILKTILASLVSLILFGAVPAYASFSIFYYQDGSRINNISQAQALIDNSTAIAMDMSENLNIRDGRSTSGHFNGDATVVPLTVQNNFAVYAVGQIYSEVTTDYTFNIHSDDGYQLSVNGVVVSEFVRPRAPRDTTQPTIQLNAGYNHVEVVYFERVGRASLELSIAEGNFTSFAAGSSAFELAVASTPEPSTWALMILGFALVGARLKQMKRGDVPSALSVCTNQIRA